MNKRKLIKASIAFTLINILVHVMMYLGGMTIWTMSRSPELAMSIFVPMLIAGGAASAFLID